MDLDWIPILAIGGSYVLAGFICWAIVRGRQRRAELRAEVQTRLIEKFGSAPELLQFMQSEQGKALVGSLEQQPAVAAGERAMRAIRSGIILTFIGLAFLLTWLISGPRGMMFPGILLTALGAAFFLAAFVTVRLSRRWGLGPRESERAGDS